MRLKGRDSNPKKLAVQFPRSVGRNALAEACTVLPEVLFDFLDEVLPEFRFTGIPESG